MAKTYEKTMSATEVRNHWFEVLNEVHFRGETVVIEKNKMPLVKMIPAQRRPKLSAREVIARTHGYLRGHPASEWPKASMKLQKEKWAYLESLWKK